MSWRPWVLTTLAGVGVAALGVCGLIGVRVAVARATTFAVAPAQFASPWPLTEEQVLEVVEAGVPVSNGALEQAAARRAAVRGQRMMTARLGCFGCHGYNLGGRVVVDDLMSGRRAAPNLTSGPGGLAADYGLADFERQVRHAVARDGTSSLMSSVDYTGLSDREVSDLWAYVRAVPPVERDVGTSALGIRDMLELAFGDADLPASRLDHTWRRPTEPPDGDDLVAYGGHLVKACRGCHGLDLRGGAIEGGDPDWPPASDLTALSDWSLDEFVRAMREGVRPDGTPIDPVMPWWSLTELDDQRLGAMHAYLSGLSVAR